jgi:branched-chain amino acid transport system permease protein
MALEAGLLRTLYARDHLSQVLATFALILILNDGTKMIFGNDLPLSAPAALAGPVELQPGLQYPAYRLLILGVGLALALLLWLLVQKTRMGALVRAGASNREMATAMGTDIPRLFTIVFGIGAALCAVAGALLGPLLAVQVGMGENILILAFVVIVIGGIGSIRGALVGAILVGCIDTLGRTLLQHVLREFLPPQWASAAGPAIASIAVYVFMAIVLAIKPQGLFPARG